MIQLDNISRTYILNKDAVVEAVRGVNLIIDKGDYLIITGRSGSGKTTLLNLASGLTRPTTGRVILDGVDFWTLSDRQQSLLRSQKLGFIFQFPSLIPTLNVQENVVLPVIFNHKSDHGAAMDRANELLKLVGLESKRDSFPRQLSAGQQQRVVIARALMNLPEILLADEPTSDLDEHTEHEIIELISQIHSEKGITIVMVTHTLQLASYGTKAIEMAEGMIKNSTVH